MDAELARNRTRLGTLTLGCWLFLFCGGLLLETSGHRELLAPNYFKLMLAQDRALLSAGAAGESDAPPSPAAANASDNDPAATPTAATSRASLWAFTMAALFYAPLNLAFLTMAAGLLGGCSSNLAVETVQPASETSQRYMSELPWSGMIRSFIVYLCLIAGLYFALEDPFKATTPPMYLRLAGTFSLLGFIVGYDPSKFRQWLDAVPGPRPAGGQTASRVPGQTLPGQSLSSGGTTPSGAPGSGEVLEGPVVAASPVPQRPK